MPFFISKILPVERAPSTIIILYQPIESAMQKIKKAAFALVLFPSKSCKYTVLGIQGGVTMPRLRSVRERIVRSCLDYRSGVERLYNNEKHI
jgi:hypothetical protein